MSLPTDLLKQNYGQYTNGYNLSLITTGFIKEKIYCQINY